VRQEPIGPYVVDFICRERRLIIEVDRGQHADNMQDGFRDQWRSGNSSQQRCKRKDWAEREPHTPPRPACGER